MIEAAAALARLETTPASELTEQDKVRYNVVCVYVHCGVSGTVTVNCALNSKTQIVIGVHAIGYNNNIGAIIG